MIRFSGALCTLCSMYCLMEAIGNPTPAPTSRPPAGQEASVSYKVSTSALFGLFYMVFIIALGAHLLYFFCIRKVPVYAKFKQNDKYSLLSGHRNYQLRDKKSAALFQNSYYSSKMFGLGYAQISPGDGQQHNSAFIFVKPHAIKSTKILPFVQNFFAYHNLIISKKGSLTANLDRLIDKTFSKDKELAVTIKPNNYFLTEKMKSLFFFHFGENWDECVQTNSIFNAADACTYLGVDDEQLLALWIQCSRKQSNYAIISPWMRCCNIGIVPGKKSIYCINGYYMGMRRHYSSQICQTLPFFFIEWNPSKMTWKNFLHNIIGDENPERALVTTLRGVIYRDWKQLGLEFQPNIVDNCIHASASAFEALIEKCNFLSNWNMNSDSFANQLLQNGMSEEKILKLGENPEIEGLPLFNYVLHLDASSTVAVLKTLAAKREEEEKDNCVQNLM